MEENMKHKNSSSILKVILLISIFFIAGITIIHAKNNKNTTVTNTTKTITDTKTINTNKDLTIEYDFETGTFEPDVKKFVVEEGRNIVFKIKNFNRIAFKVTFNGEPISDNSNSTIPSIFASIQEEKSKVKIEKKPEIFHIDSLTQSIATEVFKEILLSQINSAIKNLQSIIILRNSLEENQYNAQTYSQLEFLNNEAFNNFFTSENNENITKKEVLDRCNMLYKNSEDIKNKTIAKINEHSKNSIDLLNSIMNNNSQEELKKKIKEYQGEFRQMGIDSENCIDFLDQFYTLKNLLENFNEKKYIEEIEALLNKINSDQFSVSYTIPSVTGDYVKITVNIEPVDKKKNQVFHALSNPVIVWIKNGWKIDFSTGVLFTIDWNRHSYWLEDIEGDSSKVILREGNVKANITPIIGALMHVYPRRSQFLFFKDVNWSGLAFGLGTGEANKLSYYLGTGLMFGYQKRFLINFGLALIKTDSLVSQYKNKINEEIYRPSDSASLIESYYKVRAFLSLTYNL